MVWNELVKMVTKTWSEMRRTFPPVESPRIGTALTTYDEDVLRDIYSDPIVHDDGQPIDARPL